MNARGKWLVCHLILTFRILAARGADTPLKNDVPGKDSGFIGFDCAAKNVNITSISRNNIDECTPPSSTYNTTETNIQVLQVNDFAHIHVKQCKVEIMRTVYFCGQGHHLSAVHNGLASFIKTISREACELAHVDGNLMIANNLISDLKINHTISIPVTLAGTVDYSAYCTTENYRDVYGSWSNVVVQAIVTVTLNEYNADVDLNNNLLKLRSGIECRLTSLNCFDVEGGQTFWNTIPSIGECSNNKYSKVYEGPALKIMTANETMFTVRHQSTSFTFPVLGRDGSCNFNMLRTQHPKLFIVEMIGNYNYFNYDKGVNAKNIDLFKYINSKFLHVESHIRFQINEMFERLIIKRCELERTIMEANLGLAVINPDEFVMRYKKSLGYTALVNGEAIHIIKCIPVNVQLRKTDKCYDKIAVSAKEQQLFLNPVTRILSTQASEIACHPMALPYFQIDGVWYIFAPEPIEAPAPITLKPQVIIDWQYKSLDFLLTSGLYSESDLEGFKELLRSAQNRVSIVNQFAKVISNVYDTPGQSFTMEHLLNKGDITKIVQNTWDRVWAKVISFGNVCGALLGIFVIIKLLRSIIKSVTDGYALGWSFQLVTGLVRNLIRTCLLGENESKVPVSQSDLFVGQMRPQGIRRNLATVIELEQSH